MKTMTRSNIYLPIAAMIVTTALAIPAAAQKQVGVASRDRTSITPSRRALLQ